MNPAMRAEPANAGLSMTQIWSIVWAYKVHAAVIAVVIIAITAVVIKIMPKSYSATATLMVNYEVNDPMAGQGQPTPIFAYMSTEVQLMQSAEVLLPVIDRLNLTENKSYTAGYSAAKGGSVADWVKEKLVKDLEIEPGRAGGQLIFVSASSENATLASQIANSVVDIYLSQERQRTSGPASERAKRYAQELAELKDKVNIAQEQVTRFRQRSGVTDGATRNASIDADLLAGLETRLQEAQNARRAAEVKASGDLHLTSDATTSSTILALKAQINAGRVQIAQLRATLGVAHPKVVELQNQVDANQRLLDTEFGSVSASASAELAQARQLESKLQAAVEEQRNKVLGINRLQDEGTKYVLELESAQAVYKRALEGYDQIMFASGGNTNKMSVVSRAVPPQKATKPNKVKLLMMGVFAGLFLGLAGPVAYELLLDRRIRCPDDFERGFAVPVLMEFGPIAARGAA